MALLKSVQCEQPNRKRKNNPKPISPEKMENDYLNLEVNRIRTQVLELESRNDDLNKKK